MEGKRLVRWIMKAGGVETGSPQVILLGGLPIFQFACSRSLVLQATIRGVGIQYDLLAPASPVGLLV